MTTDCSSENFRVLKDNEIRSDREYRIRRLVLAVRDRVEANGLFAALGLADYQVERPVYRGAPAVAAY